MLNKNTFARFCFVTLALIASTFQAGHAAPLNSLADGQVGRIEFNSSNPPNRWAMIRGQLGGPQLVFGDLLLPKTAASERVPVVVFSHGSEGASAVYFDVWAKELNAAGIAVFVVDSFKPRGLDNILGADKQLSYDALGSNVADALNALRLLATHPRIDPARIFHMGWSRGGSAVLAAAWPAYQTGLPAGMRWAGSVAVYPGCNIRYRSETPALPAPLLMLLGAKDDMTPAAPCVAYAQDLAAAGHPVTYKLYNGAYHVFDRLNQRYNLSRQGTYRDCDMDIMMPTKSNPAWVPGIDRRTKAVIANAGDFAAAYNACETVANVVSESNTKAREQAVADVIAFIGAVKK